MDTNWKDTLEMLKNSGNIPQGETSNEESAQVADSPADCDNRSAGRLHVLIEKKGRKGKTATIIEGFTCSDDRLQEIARQLKQRIGTGGSARGGEILLQGDFRDKVRDILKSEGFSLK